MPGPGQTTLLDIRTEARQRANMENSQFVTDVEFNNYIKRSYQELYDILIQKYSDNYYVAAALPFQTDGQSQFYPLPDGSNYVTDGVPAPAFYKLLGVDLALSNQLDSLVTIKNFMFNDRNRYAVPNFQSFYGVTNLRYRVNGTNLWFTPIPAGNQTLQLWYIPKLNAIQFIAIGDITTGSAIVTNVDPTDIANLSVGMIVSNPAFPSGSTITVIGTDTFTVSANATAPFTASQVYVYDDNSTFDFVSGWEEYLIVDAARKALIKEESDVTALENDKAALIRRIESAAENRDAANPAVTVDTQYQDSWWPNGSGNGGYGGVY